MCWGRASQVAQVVKNPPANAGDMTLIPGSRRSPEVRTCSSILAWKITWTEGSQRVRHDWVTERAHIRTHRDTYYCTLAPRESLFLISIPCVIFSQSLGLAMYPCLAMDISRCFTDKLLISIYAQGLPSQKSCIETTMPWNSQEWKITGRVKASYSAILTGPSSS